MGYLNLPIYVYVYLFIYHYIIIEYQPILCTVYKSTCICLWHLVACSFLFNWSSFPLPPYLLGFFSETAQVQFPNDQHRLRIPTNQAALVRNPHLPNGWFSWETVGEPTSKFQFQPFPWFTSKFRFQPFPWFTSKFQPPFPWFTSKFQPPFPWFTSKFQPPKMGCLLRNLKVPVKPWFTGCTSLIHRNLLYNSI